MTNPTAAMLVIGDEILSGRTRDGNTHYLAGQLTQIGIRLMEVRVVADEAEAIIEAVNALRVRWDTVFTSGGIGPTHDDITAEAIAAAFGVGISQRADALALLQAHYDRSGLEFNEARRQLPVLKQARVDAGERWQEAERQLKHAVVEQTNAQHAYKQAQERLAHLEGRSAQHEREWQVRFDDVMAQAVMAREDVPQAEISASAVAPPSLSTLPSMTQRLPSCCWVDGAAVRKTRFCSCGVPRKTGLA